MGGPTGNLVHSPPCIQPGFTADKLPDVTVKGAVLGLHAKKRGSIVNSGGYFQPVAHDAFVAQQRPNFPRAVSRDLLCIEAVEGSPIVLPLFENGLPAQPCLGALEDEQLEKRAIIVVWHTPL